MPSEVQPQVGDRPTACSGVLNQDMGGECENVQQGQGGSQETCDNSVDDNLDGNVDGSDCVPIEGEQTDALNTILSPSDQTRIRLMAVPRD